MVRGILSTTSRRGSGSYRDQSAISSFIAGFIEMIRARYIAAILIAACLAAAAEPHGRAYLFRGLIGLIDWGMDEMDPTAKTPLGKTCDDL